MEIEVHADVDGRTVRVGRLYATRRRGIESSSFVYADDWVGSPESFALEPALPLVTGTFHTAGDRPLFGCFADSAPDRWGRALIRRQEARRAASDGVTARSFGEIDYLTGVRDDLRQGALRFRRPGGAAFLAEDSTGVPDLLELPRLLDASEAVERNRADDADLALLLRAGSSLGGARPKAHVRRGDGTLAIAKFPRVASDEWDVMAWERVALILAARAGIRVPASELLRVADRSVLVVDRFDRDARGRRIGYLSAMTMLEARDGETRSYLEIAAVIEEASSSPSADLHELWRRIAFGILVSNTDDHLRNHGFLQHSREGVILSPAFDLNPDPLPGAKHLATAIDENDTAARIAPLLAVSPYFRLDEKRAREVLDQVADAVAGWRAVANDLGIPREECALMATAFDNEARAELDRL